MKRKLLPVFLSFALLANGSLTAFAADPVADAVTESDVQTTVSEDQENQEEVTVPEGETSEEEKDEASVEAPTPDEEVKEEDNSVATYAYSDTYFEDEYKKLTALGAPVTGETTVNAIGNDKIAIIDVRSESNYNNGHLYGSISLPIFNAENKVAKNPEDGTAPQFKAYIENAENKAALSAKDLYILCNSGNKGAHAAAVLFTEAGYSAEKIHIITGGASETNQDTIQKSFIPTTVTELKEGDYKFSTGNEAVDAVKKGAYIIDVRSNAKRTASGSLDALSATNVIWKPLFDDSNKLPDNLAAEFTSYFEVNKATYAGKDVYILCNSGSRGAQKATLLLAQLGYNFSKGADGNIYTISGGSGSKELEFQYNLIDPSAIHTVTGEQAVAAVGDNNVVILDVRASGNYASGHLKGSLSIPLFNGTSPVGTSDEQLAQDFTTTVKDNSALNGKKIYILCNSGSRGAHAATVLLKAAGYDMSNVYTISGGYNKNTNIQSAAIYVSDKRAINALSESDKLVIDVRSTEAYTEGHLKGSLSLPLFDKDKNLPDDLAKAFTEYITAHKSELAQKKAIYILCNSGSRGAEKAIKLLKEAGLENGFIIENGAKSEVITSHFVSDSTKTPETPGKSDGNKGGNVQNTNKPATTTAATTKTGDTAPIAALAVAMLAALGAIVAFGKKKIVK